MGDGISTLADLQQARERISKNGKIAALRKQLANPLHTLPLNHWVHRPTQAVVSLAHVISTVRNRSAAASDYYLEGYEDFSYDEFWEALRLHMWINQNTQERRIGASIASEACFGSNLPDECYLGRPEFTFRRLYVEGFP